MFFRRAKPRVLSFDDRLQAAQQAGFTVQRDASGQALVSRGGVGAIIREVPGDTPQVGKAGLPVGKELATLVDAGFQKFFATPSGQKIPALAPQLKAVHAFTEDLREALGTDSYYNTSLGTTSTAHLYDRVKDRDRGVPKRPWED